MIVFWQLLVKVNFIISKIEEGPKIQEFTVQTLTAHHSELIRLSPERSFSKE